MSSSLRVVISILLLGILKPVLAVQTTPSADFTDNGDGSVTHKVTGLIWKRCVEGHLWDGKSCSGQFTRYNFDEANTLKGSFAGKSDWRLPTIAELQSIIERETNSPAVNAAIFANTPSVSFWSNTAPANVISFPKNIWVVDFDLGFLAPVQKLEKNVVRLVRGKPALDPSQEFTPSSDFTDNGNGTVTHKVTGLTWKRCAEGQTWDGKTCTGPAVQIELEEAEAIKSQFAGFSDWRIPSTNELATLIEFKKYNPAINTAIFPNPPPLAFTSSGCPLNSRQKCLYWDVGFTPDAATRTRAEPFLGSGYTENGQEVPTLDNFVRLVRGKLATGPAEEDMSVSYDQSSRLLTIPDVVVGNQHFQATLEFNGQSLFTIKKSPEVASRQIAQPAEYDVNTFILVIPKVAALGANYSAILKNIGNFVFRLDILTPAHYPQL